MDEFFSGELVRLLVVIRVVLVSYILVPVLVLVVVRKKRINRTFFSKWNEELDYHTRRYYCRLSLFVSTQDVNP
jgi:Flp pilus assembly protein TadB